MMVNNTPVVNAMQGAQTTQSGTDIAQGGDFAAALDQKTQQLAPLLQEGSEQPDSLSAAEDPVNVSHELSGDIFDPPGNLPDNTLSDKQKETADDQQLPALAGMPVDQRLAHLQNLVMQIDVAAGAAQQANVVTAAATNAEGGEAILANVAQAVLATRQGTADSANAAPTAAALVKPDSPPAGPASLTGLPAPARPAGAESREVKQEVKTTPGLPVPTQPEKPEQPASLFKPVVAGATATAADSPSLFTPVATVHTAPATSVLTGHSTSVPVTATPTPVLTQEMGSTAWQQSLGQQIAMFTRNGIHNAEIRLNPAELGVLKINLRMNSDQASLHFVSDNHQVRAALEAAIPQLRTSLAESGINLEASRVDSGSAQSWSGSAHSEWASGQTAQDENSGRDVPQADEEEVVIRPVQVRHNSGINTFV